MGIPRALTSVVRGRAPGDANRDGILAAWVALVVGVPAIVVALSPMSTVDLAYGIRTGQLVIAEAAIPRVDPFTFTAAGLPWVDQQWLAHVIFGAAYGLGGFAALQVLWLGIVVATVGLAARAAFLAGAGLRTSAVVAMAGFVVAAQGFGLRAQVFGLLCLSILLVLIAVRRSRPGALWLAVPLIGAWANLHGSFVMGLALLFVTAIEDRHGGSARWRDLVVLAGAAIATLANPYGIDAWKYVMAIGTNSTISALVTEWRHTDPLQPAGAVFYASVAGAALVVALAARRVRSPDVGSLVWLGILAGLGAWAFRAVAWWGIGAVPVVAVAVSRLRAPSSDRSGWLAVPGEVGRRRALAGAAAATVIIIAVVVAVALPADERLMDAPAGIADAVRSMSASNPGLRVFDAERWGSWLELEVPDASYFADSRIELIPASAWSDYVVVSDAQPGWEGTLDRWRVNVLAVSRVDQPNLLAAINSSATWRVVYSDVDGLVAVRA